MGLFMAAIVWFYAALCDAIGAFSGPNLWSIRHLLMQMWIPTQPTTILKADSFWKKGFGAITPLVPWIRPCPLICTCEPQCNRRPITNSGNCLIKDAQQCVLRAAWRLFYVDGAARKTVEYSSGFRVGLGHHDRWVIYRGGIVDILFPSPTSTLKDSVCMSLSWPQFKTDGRECGWGRSVPANNSV